MSKKFGFAELLFASAIGCVGGIVYYLAKNDKFSEETNDNYKDVINNAKEFGQGVKRTYTSVGNKDSFSEEGKELGAKTMDLLKSTKEMISSGAGDAYDFVKTNISEKVSPAVNKFSEYSDTFDDGITKVKKNVKDGEKKVKNVIKGAKKNVKTIQKKIKKVAKDLK
ncbi:MAG: hypothetical protein Q4F88_00120 [Eubacteriales bacterium]|nr:hypothetical protein [Eubacteriales bacterium]